MRMILVILFSFSFMMNSYSDLLVIVSLSNYMSNIRRNKLTCIRGCAKIGISFILLEASVFSKKGRRTNRDIRQPN